MNKVLYFNTLFTIYAELLTKKEQNIFSLYYEENLSLSEIAENLKTSRSAVCHTAKIVERKLENSEKKLRVSAKNELLKEVVEEEPIKEKLKQEIQKILE